MLNEFWNNISAVEDVGGMTKGKAVFTRGVEDAGPNTQSLILYDIPFLERVFVGGVVNYRSDTVGSDKKQK